MGSPCFQPMSLKPQVISHQKCGPGLTHLWLPPQLHFLLLFAGSLLFLKVKVKVKVAQACLTLCDSMACIVHGTLQARILDWVPFPFSRGSSQPKDRTQVSALQVDSLPAEPPGKLKNTGVGSLSLLQQIFQTQESNWSLLHCR